MNCNFEIENINQPDGCGNNMSGVYRLLFIPRKHVEAINATPAPSASLYTEHVTIGCPAMLSRAVTVKAGKEFGELYCAEELGELKYSLQGQKGSRSLLATLEVFHPGFKKKILGFLGSGLNNEFVILAMLANEEWHLIGSTRRGARLSNDTQATSGKAASDPNGAQIIFEWTCRMPQVFFQGWSPDDPVFGVEMFRVAHVLGTSDGRAILTNNGKLIGIKYNY